MLLGVGIVAVTAAVISIAVGEGGPGAPKNVGGVNDVQRILGGIAQDGDRLGDDDAEITISVFNDIQCADPCADFQTETVDRLVEEYARTGKAKLVFRHFSLAENDTTVAAIAAEAAGKQAHQWQYIDTFVRNHELARGQVSEDVLREVAEAVPNLEIGQWEEDYEDPDTIELVRDDARLGAELKLTANPAVVVEGPGGQEELMDTPTYEEIVAAIERVSG